ncbi:lactate utilization protein C [Kytococcus sedentarius]|uniref:lactate utilization protein C n=1 Tax=Kytococcus sedentarius TaxID=1276 RepID=UPI00387911A5
MSARGEILDRLRGALADVDGAPDPQVGHRTMPTTMQGAEPPAEGVLERFTEVVRDYRATVQPVTSADLPRAVAAALQVAGCSSVVVPTGLDDRWLVEVRHGSMRVVAEQEVDTAGLNEVDAVVTAAAVGIATTGTIVLDHGPDQGRRALSLVPDTHVCVVRAEQVVADVPQAVARLRPDAEAAHPQTWISGPSATSDIELERVEGVHGPRTLVVLLVTD